MRLQMKKLYAEGEIEFKATSEEISVVRQESKRQVDIFLILLSLFFKKRSNPTHFCHRFFEEIHPRFRPDFSSDFHLR